ncbi:tetraspanin [Trichonephila clavata]|uniref:Tetraspanin n=1 Tax=Trichonephila clavata TaxID=2740835 RepID=A0A8X6FP27_TRICU|nr:tetraspanin [Trichonephila clavata]
MTRTNSIARHSVCFLSFITWLLGGVVLGTMMWVLATTPTVKDFFSGTLVFTYIVLSIGSLLFINGILGWIGSYKRGTCLMKFKAGIVLNLRHRNWFFSDSPHRTYDFVKEAIIQEVQSRPNLEENTCLLRDDEGKWSNG